MMRGRQKDEADKRATHAEGQGIRHRLAVCVDTHQWLQDRCRHLEGERQKSDLPE